MSKYEIYKGDDKPPEYWRWRLIDNNGAKIARGGEPFHKDNIARSIKNVKASSKDALIVEDGSSEESGKVDRFAYYEGVDGQYYWKMQAGGNNKIIAIGGEGFVSEGNVIRSIKNVQQEMKQAEIVWEDPGEDPARDAKSKDSTPTKGIPGS